MDLMSFKYYVTEAYLTELKTKLPRIKKADENLFDDFRNTSKMLAILTDPNTPESSIFKYTERSQDNYIFILKHKGMGYVWNIWFTKNEHSNFYDRDGKKFTDIFIAFAIEGVYKIETRKKLSVDDQYALQQFKERYISFKFYATLMELCRLEFKKAAANPTYPLGSINFSGSAEKITGYATLGKRIVKELKFIDYFEKYGDESYAKRGINISVGYRSNDSFNYLYISPRLDASIRKFALDKTERVDVTQAKYLHVEEIKDGYSLVLGRNKLKGVIDKDGKEVVPCEYDNIGFVDDRNKYVVKVQKGEKWGLLNVKNNQFSTPIIYDYITNFGTVLEVVKGKLRGLMSKKTFKEITPIAYKEFGGDYSSVLRLRHTFIAAKDQNDYWGLFTVKGEVAIPFKYAAIQDINEVTQNAVVMMPDGRSKSVKMKY
jgi:hypothetical protein